MRILQPGVMVNVEAPLTADVAVGATTLEVPNGYAFDERGLVMVIRSAQRSLAPTLGSQAELDLTQAEVGRHALTRIVSRQSNALIVSPPMPLAFEVPGSQVVSVPEFTDVTIAPTASLVAPKWDGAAGGILIFFASGRVRVDGLISADGSGFRGGPPTSTALQPQNCTDAQNRLDEAFPNGVMRGEGVAGFFGPMSTGRGNSANGGGGGVCNNSGGGGGSHWGAGGLGGFTWEGDGSRNVGGLGGAPIRFSPLTQYVFGGGGGTGSNDVSGSTPAGGAGGGVVLIRAAALSGSGRISARGANARDSTGGCGGGGGGGVIHLLSETEVECGALSVAGGQGGRNLDPVGSRQGPGGGGGGGLLLISAPKVASSCTFDLANGLGGVLADGMPWGAAPSRSDDPLSMGSTMTFVDGGFLRNPDRGSLDSGPSDAGASEQPPADAGAGDGTPDCSSLTLLSPSPGQVVRSSVLVAGITGSGCTVRILFDEAEVAVQSAEASGVFRTIISNVPVGAHRVQVVSEGASSARGAMSEVVSIVVEAPPVFHKIGCAAQTMSISPDLLAAMVFVARRAARRRGPLFDALR
jgi:hypothetical protein